MNTKNPSVLVVVVRAGPKNYAYNFFPRFAEKLNYENKKILLVDDTICPQLQKEKVGERIAAIGRNFGLHFARENGFDYVFFLDLDLEPDPGLLTELVALDAPFSGSLVAARGNSFQIIGHNYKDRETLEREPLYYPDLKHGDEVGAIAGASLLIHKSIFNEVDYSDYTGPDTIPGRFTADDEYITLEIYKKFKIKPKIIIEPRSWHYHDDGYKYRILGITNKFSDI